MSIVYLSKLDAPLRAFTYSFIHLFNTQKCAEKSHVPGTVLGAGDRAELKADKYSYPMTLYLRLGESDNNSLLCFIKSKMLSFKSVPLFYAPRKRNSCQLNYNLSSSTQCILISEIKCKDNTYPRIYEAQ